MRRAIAGLVLALLVAIAGCAGDRKPMVAAEGKLKLSDGKPPPAGTKLMFNPAAGRTGTASGTTDADGSFKLTHVSGSTGAEIGKYSIQLMPPQGGEKEFYKLIPKDVAEGALSAEVKEGMGPLELTIPKGYLFSALGRCMVISGPPATIPAWTSPCVPVVGNSPSRLPNSRPRSPN